MRILSFQVAVISRATLQSVLDAAEYHAAFSRLIAIHPQIVPRRLILDGQAFADSRQKSLGYLIHRFRRFASEVIRTAGEANDARHIFGNLFNVRDASVLP